MFLTLETALDLHNLLLLRILNRKGGVDVEMLLDNVKQVVVAHVVHGLATGDGHDLALDAQYGLAVGHLDLEAVAGEGHDFFAKDERFRLAGDEAIKDAHLAGSWLELNGCHCEGLVCTAGSDVWVRG